MSESTALSVSTIQRIAPDLLWKQGDAADANLCITPGIWKITPKTANVPLSGYGVMKVFVAGDLVVQEITFGSARYYRFEGSITSTLKQEITQTWEKIDTTRGEVKDFNTALKSGCYYYNTNTLNQPTSTNQYGILIVAMASSNFGIQIAIQDYSTSVMYRIYWSSTFRPWYQLTSVKLT